MISRDVVNLGFVVNVIEDPEERAETLKKAYGLAQKVLSVSAMLTSETFLRGYKPFRDGIITKRQTFQKYFTQEGLKSFIETTLETNAIAVRPGVFFVFKSEDDEQEFLSNRQRRAVSRTYLIKRERKINKTSRPYVPRVDRTLKIEENKETIEKFWETCLSFGRVCLRDETELFEPVRKVFGSISKAFQYCLEKFGKEAWDQSRQNRQEDLLVFLALGLFGKRKAYSHHPKSLQRDFKEFFGSYNDGLELAKRQLFSVGDFTLIREACLQAHRDQCGYLLGDHSIQLHTSLIPRLPAILRIYIGCATQLYGDVENADLVKIHMQSRKVSLMLYDDFWDNPLPSLKERIKINLLEQKIDFFDYSQKDQTQIHYLKSRFLNPSHPKYSTIKSFDDKIQALGIFDFSGFGPPASVFLRALQEQGVNIHGQSDY